MEKTITILVVCFVSFTFTAAGQTSRVEIIDEGISIAHSSTSGDSLEVDIKAYRISAEGRSLLQAATIAGREADKREVVRQKTVDETFRRIHRAPVIREVRIPVDRPVFVDRPVPYPVDRPVPYPVDRPVPYPVPYPYPVTVPVATPTLPTIMVGSCVWAGTSWITVSRVVSSTCFVCTGGHTWIWDSAHFCWVDP